MFTYILYYCIELVYLSDGGRSHVMEAGGAAQLLSLLKRAVDYPENPENHQLRLVATGFLLNLLNSYETDQVGLNCSIPYVYLC